MTPTLQILGAAIFAVAIAHTFATKFFDRMAQARPAHAGLWHLLGEVEVVFGFWSLVLIAAMFGLSGWDRTLEYVDSRNFTEPMFVFAIMVIAGTRPILESVRAAVNAAARLLPLPTRTVYYFLTLSFIPLLGSFITEPAAMTLAALMLRDEIFGAKASRNLKYATLGVLFVNISIGGTLTTFAAPPVLMVAKAWNWDLTFMLTQIGWKAAIAVAVNALGVTWMFRNNIADLAPSAAVKVENRIPFALTMVHFAFLVGVVVFSHHPALFMGLFLFFLGVTHAYERYQNRLILREGLLVAFFLAGLVILGGVQQWWLQPLLMKMSANAVFFGATALTAFTDNAALTYLGSLVEGLSDEFKYALVTGAVTGGGLTLIANAPNPAGASILRGEFADEEISALGLALAAAPPTLVAMAAFLWL